MTPTASIKLGLIADIHHGADRDTLVSRSSLATLEEFVDACNEQRVDAVVDLGDRINDISPDVDRQLLGEVAARFAELRMPRIHLLGNHDVRHLDEVEHVRILGLGVALRDLTLGGVRLLAVQAPHGLLASEPSVDWLLERLRERPDVPTLVFTHVVPSGERMLSNYWFHEHEHRTFDRPRIVALHDLLHAEPALQGLIGGHRHWNSWTTVDGVHYVSIQGVADTFVTHPKPASAWALMDLSVDGFTIDVHGRDPRSFGAPFRGLGRRWLPPLVLH